jgi:hypothetical protein
MEAVIAGAAFGLLVGVPLGRWRGRGLGIAYGLVAAGGVWTTAATVASYRAHEMAGIPYAVAASLAFWSVVVPAGLVALLVELRNRRERRDSRDPRA